MNWLRKLWNHPRPQEPAEAVPDSEPTSMPAHAVEPVAFISDIHGNLQALQAVLADIAAQGMREVICLGDIVGYGGNPAECVKLIREAGIPSVRGNHDAYAGGTSALPAGRGEEFERGYRWIRNQIGEDSCKWLGTLPFTLTGEDFEATHSSLNNPERWLYLQTSSQTEPHFAHQTKPVSFVGHTHLPMMWLERTQEPAISSLESLRDDRKQVVNVGAVGQPRDGNPDA